MTRVHVSLHDVTPAFEPEMEQALARAAGFGLRPALLVVPDHHGRWPLEQHPAFCARLRALQSAGHEVFLHGFFHRAPERGGLGALWAQKVVSNGEAEFAALDPAEAGRRLDEGRALLERIGLRVDGFVPPAWSFSPRLIELLAERGFAFTEDHLRIYQPARGLARGSLVLNFASRSASRRFLSVSFCRAARPLARFLPARVAVHPGDMRIPVLRREVDRLLAWAGPRSVSAVGALFEAEA
jgi:predicted deacetylase